MIFLPDQPDMEKVDFHIKVPNFAIFSVISDIFQQKCTDYE